MKLISKCDVKYKLSKLNKEMKNEAFVLELNKG